MTNKQLAPKVRAWLKSTDLAPEDARRSVGILSSQVEQARQRGRWWPLPALRRRAKSPAAIQAAQYQPSPIPASNGHTPTAIGRTQSMLSPVKAITAGAVVFAIGGALLIAQPFDEQASVPSATGDGGPAWVTGTIEFGHPCRRGDPIPSENGVVHESFACGELWTADDPRLTGEARKMWRSDGYRTEGAGYQSVIANRHVIDTEGGTWECQSVEVGRGTGLPAAARGYSTITCVGDGSHEGLTAIVQVAWAEVGHPFEAIIFSGEIPAAPDASDFE